MILAEQGSEFQLDSQSGVEPEVEYDDDDGKLSQNTLNIVKHLVK